MLQGLMQRWWEWCRITMPGESIVHLETTHRLNIQISRYIQGKILAKLEELTATRGQWISPSSPAHIYTNRHMYRFRWVPAKVLHGGSVTSKVWPSRQFLGNTSPTPARDAWLIERPGLTAMKGQDASQPEVNHIYDVLCCVDSLVLDEAQGGSCNTP